MIAATRPAVDADGYLIDPEEWTEAFARETAAALGVEMSEEHWDVVRFMREEREKHGVSPDARHVIRHLAETRGAHRNRLFEPFPYGYPGQACRIAGMKRPRVWSTG
ncbi:MAG: TusE/DsrC/DsvC family sulfur relay protein [Hyphomicrobiales bacterium]|nr:TusE/DsrC/DsvC family sulfur relay protein [Hyphomicrobiales bacterium]